MRVVIVSPQLRSEISDINARILRCHHKSFPAWTHSVLGQSILSPVVRRRMTKSREDALV